MYEYRVPFSTKEDKKIVFNLSIREFIALLVGSLIGMLIAVITAGVLEVEIFPCLPIAIPFVVIAAFLSFKKIKRGDAVMTVDRYLLIKISYHMRPKHYVLFRKQQGKQ